MQEVGTSADENKKDEIDWSSWWSKFSYAG